MKVLAVLIILVALVIIIVPQFTNCEASKDDSAMAMSSGGRTTAASYVDMESPEAMGGTEAMTAPSAAPAAVPYRMMKCYWTAHAEIVAGVPLIAIGVLLFFARRKETTRMLGILTVLLGVLTILILTSIIGTCLNAEMVCNTEMRPVLLICGGVVAALGVAVLVMGEMKRENGSEGATPA